MRVLTIALSFCVSLWLGGYVLDLLDRPSKAGSSSGTNHLVKSMMVDEEVGTWVEIQSHWTGAFSGYQHTETQVYYVRTGLFTRTTRKLIYSCPENEYVEFNRRDAHTIELVRRILPSESQGITFPAYRHILATFRFTKPYPQVENG